MKYKVVVGINAESLNDQVNNLINDGWVPYGEHKISLCSRNENWCEDTSNPCKSRSVYYLNEYSQAMIKQ